MDKTFLSVKNLSEKLGVSEKTIYRMVADNKIPYCLKIGGQWRFNTEKIQKWVESKGSSGGAGGNCGIKLYETVRPNCIMYKVMGGNRDEAIDEMLNISGTYDDNEINIIKRSILWKESIISSCISGAAFMCVDYDENIHVQQSETVTAFLDKPVDFKAVDGMKCSVIFMIIPESKSHQIILTTRLRALLMHPEYVAKIVSQPSRAQLTQLIKNFETTELLS